MSKKILQMIPADGWKAVFAVRDAVVDADGEDERHEWGMGTTPLACWALVNAPGLGKRIEGVVAGIAKTQLAEDRTGFLGYLEPAKEPWGSETFERALRRYGERYDAPWTAEEGDAA